MIKIQNDQAEVRFPWPTNDIGSGRVLKEMRLQAASAIQDAKRTLSGPLRYTDCVRTEIGWEFVFQAELVPLPTTEEVQP